MRHSHRRARGLVATAALLAVGGCSVLVDTGGFAGGSERASSPIDGAVEGGLDAPPSGEADAADGDAGPRKNACGALLFGTDVPVPNGGFELACSNGWTGFQATITEETELVAAGKIACRVCYTAGENGFFIRAWLPINVVPGENYEMVACVRGVPDADAGATMPFGEVVTSAGASSTAVAVTAGSTYVPVRAALDIVTPASQIGVDVRAEGFPGECFLVDDVRLARVRDASSD